MTKYNDLIEDEISITFEKGFDFQSWHHFCFVFSSFPEVKLRGEVKIVNKLYVDGKYVKQGES